MPDTEKASWEKFQRDLKAMRPWMLTMAIIDMVLGVMSLPLGAGTAAVGVLLLVAERRLKDYLEGKAEAIAGFGSGLKAYFITAVIVSLAGIVLAFFTLFLYMAIVFLVFFLAAVMERGTPT